jgi:NADH-quinone oxidoreductase subunit J
MVESIGHTELIGKALFTDFLLPFEIASILLLVAIVGAIVLAKREV